MCHHMSQLIANRSHVWSIKCYSDSESLKFNEIGYTKRKKERKLISTVFWGKKMKERIVYKCYQYVQ